MKETLFRNRIIKHIRSTGSVVQAIESEATGVGIPDIFIRTAKTDCWAECKVAEWKNGYIKLSWRPGQLMWLKNYEECGGRAMLFISFIDSDDEEAIAIIKQTRHMKERYKDSEFVEYCYDYAKLSALTGNTLIALIDL
jgi:hypothetical protein